MFPESFKKMSNMNSIIYKLGIASLLAAVLVLSPGCSKFLEQDPEDSLTEQEFFRSEEDANAAIVSVYDQLQDCVEKFLVWGEARADLVSPVSRKNDQTWLYELTYPNNLWALTWGDVYQVIGGANTVIARVPGITQLDSRLTQQESDIIVGEAHFLRALAYFYLVRTFGDVPLVLEPPLHDEVNFKIPKSDAAVILAKIESDLAVAEQSVPPQYENKLKTRGRATQGAVHALQADVYLWQAKYSEAAIAAKKVMDNTTLYSLVPGTNWFDIFAFKNSTEGIFEVQFDYLLRETNSLMSTSDRFIVNPNHLKLYEDVSAPDKVRGLDASFNPGSGGRVYWKYAGLSTMDLRRSGDDPNFIVYRLADVILMRAEALSHLEDDDKTEAVRLVNLIRARANMPEYDINLISTDTNSLIEIIFKERSLELAMEGKRWYDLVRIGKNGRPEFLVDKIVASRLISERALARARVADPRSWFLPIHINELAANPALLQNPYYK
jgi:hypothetical protein